MSAQLRFRVPGLAHPIPCLPDPELRGPRLGLGLLDPELGLPGPELCLPLPLPRRTLLSAYIKAIDMRTEAVENRPRPPRSTIAAPPASGRDISADPGCTVLATQAGHGRRATNRGVVHNVSGPGCRASGTNYPGRKQPQLHASPYERNHVALVLSVWVAMRPHPQASGATHTEGTKPDPATRARRPPAPRRTWLMPGGLR